MGGFVFFFVPLWAPQVIFSKLLPKQTCPSKSAFPPFSLSDVFILFVNLSIANAIVGLARNEVPTSWIIGYAACFSLLTAMIWLKCLEFMNRHGIYHQPSRLFMQALLYPMSVYVGSEIVMSSLMLMSMISSEITERLGGHPLTIAAAVMLGLSISALLVVRYLFKRFIFFDSLTP